MRHDAIYNIYSNVVSIDDDSGAFDANGNIVQIDENAISYEISRLNSLKEKNKYKEQRAAAYPSFADQFDLLYHGGYDAWKAAISTVKETYPKG
jgi:hypothetical protein